MTEPATLDEFNDRIKQNTRYSGTSPGGVLVHLPCPFCATADFMVFNVLATIEAFANDNTCRECGRSLKAVVVEDGHGVTTMTFLQTGGAEPPSYLPKMPRAKVTT